MVIFDLTDAKTFDSVKSWVESIKENAEEGVPIILVGNKKDLDEDRVVTFDDGSNLAKTFNYKYFEVSAKNDDGLEEAFTEVFESIIHNKGDDGLGLS